MRSGLELDMLAGVAKNASSSVDSSTAQARRPGTDGTEGGSGGAACTATGEAGAKLAFADVWARTERKRLAVRDCQAPDASACRPEQLGVPGVR
jgi:hypothetical protein